MMNQQPDLTRIPPEARAAFLAQGARILALERAMKTMTERVDAAGLPSAQALLRPMPTRPAPATPHNPKPPSLPTQISIPSSLSERVAQAIRVHSALDANSRNAVGAIRISASGYAQATANRISAMWLDPTLRAAAEKELADTLPAEQSEIGADFEAEMEAANAAVLAGTPRPGDARTAEQVLAAEAELDRLFGS